MRRANAIQCRGCGMYLPARMSAAYASDTASAAAIVGTPAASWCPANTAYPTMLRPRWGFGAGKYLVDWVPLCAPARVGKKGGAAIGPAIPDASGLEHACTLRLDEAVSFLEHTFSR